MGVDKFGYNVLLLLHIASAIVGFGGVILSGVYAARAKKRPPAEALAIMETNTFVADKVATIFIYLTALWGFGLVGMSDETWKFSQAWIWVSIVLYVVAVGMSHGLMRPRVKKMLELMRAQVSGGSSGAGAEMTAVEQQVGIIGAVLDVILVVIIILMIWKPGAPF